ncbi:putative tetraspanin-19 [Rhinatrema bivittatum]|uniref:putative tetraspanin-19 n=1 Tax=Rhinatrema bivittatum TaxID=194408 RepID=UPI00112B4476|nr:putative tetraspanin-19 [Rhinatrema bivittatum]
MVNKMLIKDQIYVLTYFICIFNDLFLILGLIQMGYGIWILFDQNSFLTVLVYTDTKKNLLIDIAFILLYAGIFTTIPYILGCLGIVKKSRLFLILFMILISQVSVVQATIIILLFSQKTNIIKKMNSNFDILIMEYGNLSLPKRRYAWELLNVIQITHSCCGRTNSSDWNKNDYVVQKQRIPCSCTNSPLKKWFCELSQYNIHAQGCEAIIADWFNSNMYSLYGVEIGLFILQLFLMAFTLVLLQILKKKSTISTKT